MTNARPVIHHAFRDSSPALFGYIALGLSFGFLFVKMGLPWYLAPLMSLLVYAGAAQFIALTLLANHAGLVQILSATFFVNLRHIFYGLSFLGKFPKNIFLKPYMVFGLTDEAYSILTAKKSDNRAYYFWVILFAHSYWIIGSLIGALIGASIHIDLSFLEFALTALFVVLAVEHCIISKRYFSLLAALVSSAIALLICPDKMLIIAIGISTILLALCYAANRKQST